MTTQQPEALRLRDLAHAICNNQSLPLDVRQLAFVLAAGFVEQHARITELESQLAQRFDAADMATAAAQGFRDGVASLGRKHQISKRSVGRIVKGESYV